MKRIYEQTIFKWGVGSGISIGTFVGLLFAYLNIIGAISITGYSGDMVCAGTIEDPCIALINLTANEDIFIYPIGYDPWGRNTTFIFQPGVKSWKLQRSWGNGWRDIPLNKTCTGTWCGAPDNKGVFYSFVFRKNRDYQLRIVAYKNNPYENVKWSVDYNDREYLDPTWKGIEEIENIEKIELSDKLNKTLIEDLNSLDKELRETSRNETKNIDGEDFTKEYISSEKQVKIKDSNDKTILDLKLTSPYIVSGLIASNDTMVAWFDLIEWNKDSKIFDSIKVYDKKNNYSEVNRTFRLKYGIEEYVCHYKGYCENDTEWITFENLSELPKKENIKISLWTETFPNEKMEWVPTINGFEVLEYAEWDVTTASYRNIKLDINSQGTISTGVYVTPNGSSAFITDYSTDRVFRYDLTIPYNFSSVTYRTPYLSHPDSQAHDLFFSPDGKKLMLLGDANNRVYEYSCSVGFNLSTCSSAGRTFTTFDSSPLGFYFNTEGTLMYIVGSATDKIYEYSLGTAWTLSSVTHVKNVSNSGLENNIRGMAFKYDGSILYQQGSLKELIYQLECSTPWEIDTCVYDYKNFSVASQTTGGEDVFFSYDGLHFYVTSATRYIYQYDMETSGEEEDTCDYTSGNWVIDCSENCTIDSNTNVGGNNITFSGKGLINLNANITNYDKLDFGNNDGICSIYLKDGVYIT